ncbi:MAG: Gfo/Idh/MocA family oxidoreductase [Acidobacteria bacterium]|nr:Gfo/Idh/MocA family oxidoreductase [Acidobacteriota bacterium]MBI3279993.1 Gfo/Idh/MocA family oxidoreductase [Acidobacteriota bacterium]
MRKIKTAVIGAGFMGKVHTEAIRRLGNVEVVAVAAKTAEEAKGFGDLIGVDRTTGEYSDLLRDPEIQAVHICTPNVTHCAIAKAAVQVGKAVLCEKPLTMTAAEARELAALAESRSVANCVNHNLRCYPVLQHIRQMIAAGELGEILVVQGTYSQDWLLYDTDWNWRVLAEENGRLRAMGDIGSHWMDMIMHLTGLRITALCADLQTVHKVRKSPKHAVETFTGKTLHPEDYEEVPITTEDYGAVLLHLGERTRGAFTVSQVSAGCKNRFQVEIYGTRGGVMWNQERPDELWVGSRNSPNQLILKDPSLLKPNAATYADLPGGHGEGYDDTHKQMFRRFYRKVADASAPVEYPTFADGLRIMELLEKVVESAGRRGWVEVGGAAGAGA